MLSSAYSYLVAVQTAVVFPSRLLEMDYRRHLVLNFSIWKALCTEAPGAKEWEGLVKPSYLAPGDRGAVQGYEGLLCAM